MFGDSSPAREYFLWHVGLPNTWRGMNIIPGIVSAVAAGNLHSGNEFVFYLVFSILIGLVFSFLLLLFRMKCEQPTTILG
jgi:hypothetical protein